MKQIIAVIAVMLGVSFLAYAKMNQQEGDQPAMTQGNQDSQSAVIGQGNQANQPQMNQPETAATMNNQDGNAAQKMSDQSQDTVNQGADNVQINANGDQPNSGDNTQQSNAGDDDNDSVDTNDDDMSSDEEDSDDGHMQHQ